MKILMIGNSYTFFNDLPGVLAKKLGAEVRGNLKGGASLIDRLDPASELGQECMKLLSEKWDYVVLQDHSRGPVVRSEEFFRASAELCALAKKAGAVPVFYSTWAYQKGGPTGNAFGMDYGEMYRALSAAYAKAASDNGGLVAEVGKAFYESDDVDALFDPDGSHPSPAGTELAASVMAEVIRRNAG